ncbi:MAG: N-acetyltransferase, partial [Methanobacteriota archaeon]
LASRISARVPPSWPPELLSDDILRMIIRRIKDGDDPLYFSWYWVLRDAESDERVLVGFGGFSTAAPDGSSAEMGYMVAGGFQGRGLATEAVHHLCAWLFTNTPVMQVVACTFPDHRASIRVLETNGFLLHGDGPEEGTVRYLLARDRCP